MAVVHRIYAEALLAAAREHDALAAVRGQFDEFVAAAEASPDLRNLLRNPQVEPATRRAVLEALLAEADERFRNFVLLLAEKHRVAELEQVYDEWQRLLAREERVLEVELTTAVELSDGAAAAVVAQIERAVGRRVEVTRRVDFDLIGGVILQVGSLRVDASVRGRLNQLREDLLART